MTTSTKTKPTPDEGRALRRIGDVNRLAVLRNGRWERPAGAVLVYADALRIRGHAQEVIASMVWNNLVCRHGLAIDRGTCSRIVAEALRRQRLLSPAAAGHHLMLTKAERRLLRISSAEAVDETLWERDDHRDETRRIGDRERKRKARAGKHRPQAESVSRRKPWKAFGWSRSKWYAAGQPEPVDAVAPGAVVTLIVTAEPGTARGQLCPLS